MIELKLNRYAKKVDKFLLNFLKRQSKSLLVSPMKYGAISGGKKIRSTIIFDTGKIFGLREKKLLNICAAVECIHSYSLIHDDLPCMDDDDIRRGKPTVHKMFSEGSAVLVGDALLTEAFFSCSELPPSILKDIIPLLGESSGISGMIGGQSLDIGFETEITTVEELQQLHLAKTGALIRCAVEMGAICAGATLEQRENFFGKMFKCFR